MGNIYFLNLTCNKTSIILVRWNQRAVPPLHTHMGKHALILPKAGRTAPWLQEEEQQNQTLNVSTRHPRHSCIWKAVFCWYWGVLMGLYNKCSVTAKRNQKEGTPKKAKNYSIRSAFSSSSVVEIGED